MGQLSLTQNSLAKHRFGLLLPEDVSGKSEPASPVFSFPVLSYEESRNSCDLLQSYTISQPSVYLSCVACPSCPQLPSSGRGVA